MRALPPTLLVASLLCFPCVAHPAGIYQTEYRHAIAGIACRSRLAFVICDESCTATPSLPRAPKAVTLSARVSEDRPGETSFSGTSALPGIHGRTDLTSNPPDHEPSKSTQPTQGMELSRTFVLFALDSFTLDASQEAKLSSFVAETKDRKDFSVSVVGYTCDLGRKAHNDILAEKRARTVATYLEKAGIRSARVTGAGKCCYTTEDPSRRSLNRRVEITVTTGENR